MVNGAKHVIGVACTLRRVKGKSLALQGCRCRCRCRMGFYPMLGWQVAPSGLIPRLPAMRLSALARLKALRIFAAWGKTPCYRHFVPTGRGDNGGIPVSTDISSLTGRSGFNPKNHSNPRSA
jgi:hypothetical protein